MTAPIFSMIATALAKGWMRAVLVLYLVGLALVCIYVPWEARYRGSRSAWGYGFIWSPPAESLTVDLVRLWLTVLALSASALAALLVASTRRPGADDRDTVPDAARAAPSDATVPAGYLEAPPSQPVHEPEVPLSSAGADGPRNATDFRADGYELARAPDGRTFIDESTAKQLGADLRARGFDARVQRLNSFIRVVWAKPARRPTPENPSTPPTAETGTAEDNVQDSELAHPALLLLADPDGDLKPEFVDWDGDLSLQPGSLIPAWYPWAVDGEERSAEERDAQFRFDLDLHLSSHRPAMSSSAPGAPATPAESVWAAHDVLRALLELRSVWRQE